MPPEPITHDIPQPSTRQLLPKTLRYAMEVARVGSVQGAAKTLSLSASAIDRQILLLEDDLGVPLFERMPGGMRLTAAGEIVIVLARRWRTDIDHIGLQIKQLQGVDQGRLKLAAMDSHTNGFLPLFVARLARQYPRIQLEIDILSTDQAVAALVEGTIDIAVAFNLKPQRELHLAWSTGLPLGCIVAPSHALAGQAQASLKEVAAYPMAVQGRSLAIRRYLESRHAWLFSEGEPPVVTNSLQLVKKLVRSGSHVAITSEVDAAPELIAGELRFIPIRDRDAKPQTVGVAISARRPLPRIARIAADLLAQEIQDSLQAARSAQLTRHPKPK
jgi:DNA-binding transcriptional LysR family regulator